MTQRALRRRGGRGALLIVAVAITLAACSASSEPTLGDAVGESDEATRSGDGDEVLAVASPCEDWSSVVGLATTMVSGGATDSEIAELRGSIVRFSGALDEAALADGTVVVNVLSGAVDAFEEAGYDTAAIDRADERVRAMTESAYVSAFTAVDDACNADRGTAVAFDFIESVPSDGLAGPELADELIEAYDVDEDTAACIVEELADFDESSLEVSPDTGEPLLCGLTLRELSGVVQE